MNSIIYVRSSIATVNGPRSVLSNRSAAIDRSLEQVEVNSQQKRAVYKFRNSKRSVKAMGRSARKGVQQTARLSTCCNGTTVTAVG